MDRWKGEWIEGMDEWINRWTQEDGWIVGGTSGMHGLVDGWMVK